MKGLRFEKAYRVYKVHTGQCIVNSTRATGFKTSQFNTRNWETIQRSINC